MPHSGTSWTWRGNSPTLYGWRDGGGNEVQESQRLFNSFFLFLSQNVLPVSLPQSLCLSLDAGNQLFTPSSHVMTRIAIYPN